MITINRTASRSSLILLILAGTVFAGDDLNFPVEPELFLDVFESSEGLTFNAKGQLYIGADSGIWRVTADKKLQHVADVWTHLGQAGIGDRDILAADFGRIVALRGGPNVDGVIWRVTPEGRCSVVARGIPDPNFIVMRADGSLLVSDDFADTIYLVDTKGGVRLWSDAIQHPNGLALSPDGRTLYAAQIFTGIAPLGFSDKVWALAIDEKGEPEGEPRMVFETGGRALDGLVMDRLGRLYVGDNGAGKLWRWNPQSGESTLIAEGMPNIASMVFGEGDFDHRSIYLTTTFRGGGKIWRVPVGSEGLKPKRIDRLSNTTATPNGWSAASSISIELSGKFSLRPRLLEGLVALHGFRFDDARDIFDAVRAEDPDFAMAHWGVAMSYYHPLTGEIDLNKGRGALSALDQRQDGPKLRAGEAALIQAARMLFADGPRSKRERAFTKSLEHSRQRLPLESELTALHGISLLRGNRKARVRAIAELESLLDRHPQHPGALHALLHAYESLNWGPMAERIRLSHRGTGQRWDHSACPRR